MIEISKAKRWFYEKGSNLKKQLTKYIKERKKRKSIMVGIEKKCIAEKQKFFKENIF